MTATEYNDCEFLENVIELGVQASEGIIALYTVILVHEDQPPSTVGGSSLIIYDTYFLVFYVA